MSGAHREDSFGQYYGHGTDNTGAKLHRREDAIWLLHLICFGDGRYLS